MTDTPRTVPGAANQLLIDLGPILVFILAYNVLLRIPATEANAVYIATGLFIAVILAAIVYSKLKLGRVAPVLLITGVFVTVFGGLTIWLRDETFVQIKPTFIYSFYAAAILISLAFRQNVWRLLFGHVYILPDRIWTVLALRWASFFAFMALLNEILRAHLSFDAWLNSRPILGFGLIFLFILANTPLLMKHSSDENSPAPEQNPPA